MNDQNFRIFFNALLSGVSVAVSLRWIPPLLLLLLLVNPADVVARPIPPIPVDSPETLNSMRDNLKGHYYLTQPVHLTEPWVPVGNVSAPFTGSFDGNFNGISGLNISAQGLGGMFGKISKAYVHRVLFQAPSVRVWNHPYETIGQVDNRLVGSTAGILVGWAEDSGIEEFVNIGGELSVNAARFRANGIKLPNPEIYNLAGSAAGVLVNTPVTMIINTGSVKAIGDGARVGGIAGFSIKFSPISQVVNTGPVTGDGYNTFLGGVLGLGFAPVSQVISTGSVMAEGIGAYAGGVLGWNNAPVSQVINTGSVMADGEQSGAGGVVGLSNALISQAINTGSVMADGGQSIAGGVAGVSNARVSQVINTGSVMADGINSIVGGVVGDGNTLVSQAVNTGSVNGKPDSQIYTIDDEAQWNREVFVDNDGNPVAVPKALVSMFRVLVRIGGDKEVSSGRFVSPAVRTSFYSLFNPDVWVLKEGALPILRVFYQWLASQPADEPIPLNCQSPGYFFACPPAPTGDQGIEGADLFYAPVPSSSGGNCLQPFSLEQGELAPGKADPLQEFADEDKTICVDVASSDPGRLTLVYHHEGQLQRHFARFTMPELRLLRAGPVPEEAFPGSHEPIDVTGTESRLYWVSGGGVRFFDSDTGDWSALSFDGNSVQAANGVENKLLILLKSTPDLLELVSWSGEGEAQLLHQFLPGNRTVEASAITVVDDQVIYSSFGGDEGENGACSLIINVLNLDGLEVSGCEQGGLDCPEAVAGLSLVPTEESTGGFGVVLMEAGSPDSSILHAEFNASCALFIAPTPTSATASDPWLTTTEMSGIGVASAVVLLFGGNTIRHGVSSGRGCGLLAIGSAMMKSAKDVPGLACWCASCVYQLFSGNGDRAEISQADSTTAGEVEMVGTLAASVHGSMDSDTGAGEVDGSKPSWMWSILAPLMGY